MGRAATIGSTTRLDEETRQMIRIEGSTLHAIRIGLRWPGRAKLGVTQAEFAWLLGYRGKYETRKSYMSLLESGRAKITPRVAQLALMLELFGVPSELIELETTGKEITTITTRMGF